MDQMMSDLLKDEFSEVDIDFEHLQLDEGCNASQTPQEMDDDMDCYASELWTTSDPGSVTLPTDVYEQEDNTYEYEDEENDKDEDKNELDESEDVNNKDDSVSEDSLSSDEFSTNTESTVCHSFGIDDPLEEKLTEEQLNITVDECTAEEGSMQRDQEAGVSMSEPVSGVGTVREEELSFDAVDDLESLGNQLLIEHASHVTSFETQTPEETSSESDDDKPDDDSTRNQPSQSKSDSDMYVPFVDISPNVLAEHHARDDLREFTEEDQEQVVESLADYPSDLSHSESEECGESESGHLSTLIDTDFNDNLTTSEINNFSTEEELHDQEELIDCATMESTEKKVLEDEAIPEHEIDQKDEIISEKEDEDLSFQKKNMNKDDIQEFQPNDNIPEEDTEDLNNTTEQADQDSNTSQDETAIISEMQPKDADTLIKEMLNTSDFFIDEDNLQLDTYDWNLTEEELNINLENEENLETYTESERNWELDKARIEAYYRFFGDQDETEDQINRNHKVRFLLDHESYEYDEEEDSDSSDQTDEDPTEPASTLKSEYHSESDEPQKCLEKSKTKPKEQQYDEEEDSDIFDQTDEDPTEPASTLKSEYHSESDEPQECLEKSKTKPKEQQYNKEEDSDSSDQTDEDPTEPASTLITEYHSESDEPQECLEKSKTKPKKQQYDEEEDSDSSDQTDEDPTEPASTLITEYHSESDEPQECLEKSKTKPKKQQYDEEEDSDSSDQTDEDPTEPASTLITEYDSESDEPQEKHLCLEKSKTKPKKQQQRVSTAVKKSHQKNRCLSVLKSILALGLVTGIGLVSFWWATDNLDWIH